MDNAIIIIKEFNILLSINSRSNRPKINENIKDLKRTISQLDLIDS